MIEAATTDIELDDTVGFRVRLKFKLAKLMNDDRSLIETQIDGRKVSIAPAWGGMLKDSYWIQMNATGFETPEGALAFGERLRLTVQLVAVRHRIGADCGADKASGGMSAYLRDKIFEQSGLRCRNSVHGLDVFEDHEGTHFTRAEGDMTVRFNPDAFLDALEKYHLAVETLSPAARDILLLLNFSLMTVEPVAQTVIAISAVEMIGQDEEWSDAQKAAIQKLRIQVLEDNSMPPEEANEVASAIEKGLHKISLRQGVKRLLNKIGLPHLMKEWDQLYGERSSLVHGLAPEPGKDYGDLANRAITLCSHILLTALGKEIEGIDENLSTHFPVQARRA